MINGLIHDLLFAARSLLRRPTYLVISGTILALGIGTTTSVVSFGRAVVLQALPYEGADRLVSLYESNPGKGMDEVFTSRPLLREVVAQSRSFAAVGASYTPVSMIFHADDEAVRLRASLVEPAFFSALRVQPSLGRVFGDGDDREPGGHAIALLSHELWVERFGSAEDVIGSVLRLNGVPYEIVGVMPRGFADFPYAARQTDLWIPLMMVDEILGSSVLDNIQARALAVVGRLAAGATVDSARAELEGISKNLEAAYPDISGGSTFRLRPVGEQYFRDFRGPVLALMFGSGLLLLIGTANVANLLLARSSERRHDVAVRAALGASRGVLARHLLAESLIVSVLGGTLGAVTAILLVEASSSLVPEGLPLFVDPAIDRGMLALSFALAVTSGVGISLAPIWSFGTPENTALQGAGKGLPGGGGDGVRRGLIVAEIAIATVVLIGAGLMVRSLDRMAHEDYGFDTEDFLTMEVQVPADLYDDSELAVLADRVVGNLRAVGGVQAAAIWTPDVPSGANWYTAVRPQDRPGLADEDLPTVRFHYVGGNALQTAGLRLVSGRGIEESDRADAQTVVVVSASLAEALWPGQEPVGKILRRWNNDMWAEVVGVVQDARMSGILGQAADFNRDVYFSFQQRPTRDWALLARGPSIEDRTATLRRAVSSALPELPLYGVETMEARTARQRATASFTATIAVAFAAAAALVAAVGLYGLLSYWVSQRTHELGLRLALGAQRSDVVRVISQRGLRWTTGGILLGGSAAAVGANFLSTILYGIDPIDPLTFGVVAVLLAVVAAIACVLPVMRAARVDPMSAMRGD